MSVPTLAEKVAQKYVAFADGTTGYLLVRPSEIAAIAALVRAGALLAEDHPRKTTGWDAALSALASALRVTEEP